MFDMPALFANQVVFNVRKRPIAVAVQFAREAGICKTLEGAVRYRAGDALITGPYGECWPVSRDEFLAVYAPDEGTNAGHDGQYVKVRNQARAVRLVDDLILPGGPIGDPLLGKVGDWLLAHEDGSFGVIQNSIFLATYEPV